MWKIFSKTKKIAEKKLGSWIHKDIFTIWKASRYEIRQLDLQRRLKNIYNFFYSDEQVVVKTECVDNVQKRIASRPLNVKKTEKLGDKCKLTDDLIKTWERILRLIDSTRYWQVLKTWKNILWLHITTWFPPTRVFNSTTVQRGLAAGVSGSTLTLLELCRQSTIEHDTSMYKNKYFPFIKVSVEKI